MSVATSTERYTKHSHLSQPQTTVLIFKHLKLFLWLNYSSFSFLINWKPRFVFNCTHNHTYNDFKLLSLDIRHIIEKYWLIFPFLVFQKTGRIGKWNLTEEKMDGYLCISIFLEGEKLHFQKKSETENRFVTILTQTPTVSINKVKLKYCLSYSRILCNKHTSSFPCSYASQNFIKFIEALLRIELSTFQNMFRRNCLISQQ